MLTPLDNPFGQGHEFELSDFHIRRRLNIS